MSRRELLTNNLIPHHTCTVAEETERKTGARRFIAPTSTCFSVDFPSPILSQPIRSVCDRINRMGGGVTGGGASKYSIEK
jgi:hypothetical protein